MSNSERRQFTRIPFDGVVRFSYANKDWQGKLIDISLKGALVELPEPWTDNVSDVIEFTVTLIDTHFDIIFSGHIAHIDKNHIGIQCEHLDIDSASHLKRLVELNLGDSLLLARELHAMC